MTGPFDAPAGSKPTTYRVTITTIIPMVNTVPDEWPLETLLEYIRDHHWAEVECHAAHFEPAEDEGEDHTKAIVDAQNGADSSDLLFVGLGNPRRSRKRLVTVDDSDIAATEWEYGRDYARMAEQLGLGSLIQDSKGSAHRVWLTKDEREEVYDLWCSRKNTTNRSQCND